MAEHKHLKGQTKMHLHYLLYYYYCSKRLTRNTLPFVNWETHCITLVHIILKLAKPITT